MSTATAQEIKEPEPSMLVLNESWYVSGHRIYALERDSRDLKRCRAQVERLRAELAVLKAERKDFHGRLVALFDSMTHPAKRFAVVMAAKRLGLPWGAVANKEARDHE